MIVNFAGPASQAPAKAICSYGNAGGTVGKSMVSKGGSCRPAFIASKGRNPTFQCRRSRLQLEVAALGIRKERIGDK